MTYTVAPNLGLILWTFALLVLFVVLGWIVVRWMRRDSPVVPRIAPALLVAAVVVLLFGIIGAAAVALTLVLAFARVVRWRAATTPIDRPLG